MTIRTIDHRLRSPAPSATTIVVPVLALTLAACGGAPAPQEPHRSQAAAATPTSPSPAPATPPGPAPAASPAAPTAPTPVLKAIDAYGTTRIDVAAVKTRWGDKIQHSLVSEDGDEVAKLEAEIVDAIRAEHKEIGWVKLSPITYFQPDGRPTYLTIDVVEQADMASRLTFRPAPQGSIGDPAGLIAAWKDYEATFFGLLEHDEITPKRVDCPAFHCFGGYNHEKLKPFGEKFVRDVPPNEATLIRVLKEDKDEANRGAAAYLLAHIKDGKKLVALMIPMLDDPGSLTRNDATRVLTDVARFHPEVDIPLPPVLRAMNGPTTTDRNKAVAVVAGLVARPDGAKHYRKVIKQGGPTLLKLLALEQPNNHDFAYSILKQVSGKDLGERDVAAWQRWLAEQR
jgi:hypothetical protein